MEGQVRLGVGDVDSVQALGQGLRFILSDPVSSVERLADLFEGEPVYKSLPHFEEGCGGRGIL